MAIDPVTEAARLRALAGTGLLDTPPVEDFDRLTRLAARLLRAPTALVSLVDRDRTFFKSAVGLAEPWATRRQTPSSHSFCRTVVSTSAPLVITDARTDERVRDNPAIADLGVVAYAGVPLYAQEQPIGALCAIDGAPRAWSADDVAVLADLAHAVQKRIELELMNGELDRLADAMEAQNRLYMQALAKLPDAAVLVFDQELRFLAADGPVLSRIGLRREDMLGRLAREVHLSENVARVEALYRSALAGEESHLDVDRRGLRLHVHALPLRDADGQVRRGMLAVFDVTERHREMGMLRTLARSIPNAAVAIFDRELRYVFADGTRLKDISGLDSETIRGRPLADVLTSETGEGRDLAMYEAALTGRAQRREMRLNGRVYDHHVVPVLDDGDHVTAGLAMAYDVTDRKLESEALRLAQGKLAEQAQQLRQASITDELTGLYNRRGFTLLAEQALRSAKRGGRHVVAFFLDLNGMKQINDQLGHEMGDRALVVTAAVLRGTFREADILSRLGGDEFVALALDTAPTAIQALTTRLDEGVARYNARKEVPFELSISVGAVERGPEAEGQLDALMAKADALMYEVKRARKRAEASR